MGNVIDKDFQAFVTYKINPMPETLKDSLYQHLLSEVWGNDRWADEDIYVIVNSINGAAMIDEVRYQFGERYDEFLAEEIGDLIDKQISAWKFKNIPA